MSPSPGVHQLRPEVQLVVACRVPAGSIAATMKTITLEGQVAVVTGASRGIGRAIAETLLTAGADVVAADIVIDDPNTPLDTLVQFAQQHGRRAELVQGNVSKVEDCEKIVDTAAKAFGRIDIMVNNAGITRDTLLLRMDEQLWDAVIDTNLKSVYACSRAAARHMTKARKGCIVNIASTVGITGNAGQTNYGASKAGVIGFTKSLARELASRNVRVNAIAPGFIASHMTQALDDKVKDKVLEQIPMKRFGEPTDIANAALFLASELAGFVTGHVLVVDGGLAM